jgi:predicted small secreted protein
VSARKLSGLVLALLLLGTLAASGCNTMSGMGRDISSAGNSMESSAERNR